MDTIAKIRAAHQNPAATVDDLTAAAAGARQIAEAANWDAEAFAVERPALLHRASDKEIVRHDEGMALAKRTAEVGRALAEACDGRAAELREAAAEALRRERYDAAMVLAAALPASIGPDYAELVRLGRSIVERIAQAGRARAEANADLPKDASPLPDVEGFRRVPGIPKRVVKASLVSLYVAENGHPLSDQNRVKPRDGGMGFAGEYLTHDARGFELKPRTVEKLHRRMDFVEYETEDAVTIRNPGPFASELVIPPLYGQQPDGWRFTPGVAAASAHHVLQVLAAADTPVAEAPPARRETHKPTRREAFEASWGPLDALACNATAEVPSGLKRIVQAVTGRG